MVLSVKHAIFLQYASKAIHAKMGANVNYSMETTHLTRNVPLKKFSDKLDFRLEQFKAFECICVDGFTGLFCEHINVNDHFIFFFGFNFIIFDQFRKQMEQNIKINSLIPKPPIYQSCSTIFNGISYIFGGLHFPKQVQKKSLTVFAQGPHQ